MLGEFFPGETIEITAADLTHKRDGPVTDDATVTISIYDVLGDEVDSQEAASDEDDEDNWFAEFEAPEDAGTYTVKITAEASDGAVAKAKDYLVVKEF